MAGSSFGNIFRVTTWGESHGKALGAVIDGCPAGLPLDEADIQFYLNQRRPGQSPYASPRKEDDIVEILSGVFEGRTTGTPISLMIKNNNARSSDYSDIADIYRPGHADYTYDMKYGFRDYRGGGRSSGRETIGRVAAGAVAIKLLEQCGIHLCAYTGSIGDVAADPANFSEDEILKNAVYMPDADAAVRAEALIASMTEDHDSVGGTVECRITGVPAGLGDPVFDKLSADLAKAVCSVGAVKGFEIGDGFAVSRARGSENNDAFIAADDTLSYGTGDGIAKSTNHAGGILGGISDGSDIFFRAAIKPTPSISRPQQTVRSDGTPAEIQIHGRHDPVIVPRAVIVIKSMAALVLADALLANMTSRMEYITDFYKK